MDKPEIIILIFIFLWIGASFWAFCADYPETEYYFVVASEENRHQEFDEYRFVIEAENPVEAEEYVLNDFIVKKESETKAELRLYNIRVLK